MRRGTLAGLIASLVIVIAGGVFVSQKLRLTDDNTHKENSDLVNTTPDNEEQIDKDNDGLYINYEHGYSFTYPSDKFTSDYYHPTNGGAEWVSFEGNFSNQLNLSTGIRKDYRDHIEAIYALKPNATKVFLDNTVVLLSKKDMGSYRQMVYKSTTNPGVETESNVSYVATWIQPDYYINVILYTGRGEDAYLKKNKPMFDDIVNSLAFFELINGKPVDTVNDGTYISYKYRFQFEYPNEILKYQSRGKIDDTGMNKNFTEIEGGPKAGGLSLHIEVNEDFYKDKKYEFGEFFNAKEVKPGEKFHDWATKLSEIEKSGIKGFTYFADASDSPEPGYAYNAELYDETRKIIYKIHFSGFNKKYLPENKKYFDQIVRSFRFISQ